ncbi:MAG: PadR family transcriptional regulator [Bacillota bacterium]|nr:PadR family transcriptional regulator [Bacillota bacterium]
MAIKNKTRYAILGVLSLMSGSGYDIKKFCDKTIAHFWNENFGHIYPVLAQLEEEGLISKAASSKDERRKEYSITAKGREEFCKWMMEPIEFQPARSELLLKVSFGSNIPKERVIEMIKLVKQRYESRLEEYRAMEESFLKNKKESEKPESVYWIAPLRYGIIATEAAIKWCEETISRLNG